MIRHIGLIPDGNRRWAKENSYTYHEAYTKAMQRVTECASLFYNAGFYSCSIYLLSTANLSRGRDDLAAVFDAETLFLTTMLPSVMDDLQCKVIHAGSGALLPMRMQSSLVELCEQTKHFSERTLYLLLGYDPSDELKAAIKLVKQKNESVDFIDHLWVPERVDVIIRTAGGPPLLSNFLPLQSGYAQIHMMEKFFPDCTDEDFMEKINKAKSTNMLYGR